MSHEINSITVAWDSRRYSNSLLEWALFLYLSFFLFWGGTRSLRMPALRPASQAGPMRNPREGITVVLRDTIMLT